MDLYDGISYQLVLESANSMAVSTETDGWWRSWELPGRLAEFMGIMTQHNQASTGRERAAVQRFDGQALRAFNAIAAEGGLVKVGRGERSPHGSVLGNTAEFFKPAEFEKADAEYRAALENRATSIERWKRIYDELVSRGLDVRAAPRGSAIRLSLDSWETLLGGRP
jgi:hypothetical protein